MPAMHFFLLIASAALASAAPHVPGKAFDRFFTIWLENEDFTKVETASGLNDLAGQGILLTQYYGLTHPSQPNYLASVGGDYFGLDHDGFVEVPYNVSTLVDLFDTKNIEWKGYFEGIPGPGYMGPGSTAVEGGWDYVRKHNPFISYESVFLNGTRLAQIQSFDDFDRDVAANTLPQYAHLSPNMLNDGHNTSLEFATTWTTAFLTPLLENKEFMDRTLILLTYDESETYEVPNRIVSVLLGGAIPDALKGTEDDTYYSHYSILSSLEHNWDLPNLGRYDVGANVFQYIADETGYTNHEPYNIATVNNSLSYAGFLNSDPDAWKPVPVPNLHLTGAGGQGVVQVVLETWELENSTDTPYDGSGNIFDGGNGIVDYNAPLYKPQDPNIP